MTVAEYKTKQSDCHKKYREDLSALDKEYAMSHNTVEIGDVVTDHLGSVKVESISVDKSVDQIPTCVYFGIEVTKTGVPKKSGKKRPLWQTNIGK